MNHKALLSKILLAVTLGIISFAAVAGATLDATLAAQPAETRARYPARHPLETLTFFGIKPGQHVIEALPGSGWYTKILLSVLGSEGRLSGADYAFAMYPKFNFYSDEQIEAKKTWTTTWTAEAQTWRGDAGAAVDAFVFGSMPASLDGQADAVLFIRALHNLARFEHDGGYLTTALAEARRALKSGGIVGVVQHVAPESASDTWADGSNGYLKKSFVIEKLTAAGLVADPADLYSLTVEQLVELDRVGETSATAQAYRSPAVIRVRACAISWSLAFRSAHPGDPA